MANAGGRANASDCSTSQAGRGFRCVRPVLLLSLMGVQTVDYREVGIFALGMIAMLFFFAVDILPREYKAWEVRRKVKAAGGNPASFAERLKALTVDLARAMNQVNVTLAAIKQLSQEGEDKIEVLQKDLDGLHQHKLRLQKQIKALEDVPEQGLKEFLRMSEETEKRSRNRDYMLFFLGVAFGLLTQFLF